MRHINRLDRGLIKPGDYIRIECTAKVLKVDAGAMNCSDWYITDENGKKVLCDEQRGIQTDKGYAMFFPEEGWTADFSSVSGS